MPIENLQQYLPGEKALRKPTHVEKGNCAHCGYDIRGIKYGESCPECGNVVTDGESRQQNCPRCGYDLRGIANGRACPECGRIVSNKESKNILDDIDTPYLQRVRFGLRLIALSWPLCVLPWPISVFVKIERVQLFGMLAIGMLMAIIGVLLIASRTEAQRNAGVSARSKLDLVLMFSVLAKTLLAFGAFAFVWANPLKELAGSIGFTMFLLFFAWQAVFCIKAQRLCDLVGDEPLGREFWGLMWAIACIGSIGGPGGAAVLGQTIMVPCLVLLVFTLGIIIAEFGFAVNTWRLAGRFTWAVRYHYDVEARNARLREKKSNS